LPFNIIPGYSIKINLNAKCIGASWWKSYLFKASKRLGGLSPLDDAERRCYVDRNSIIKHPGDRPSLVIS
jgi:hypothetical protein